MKRGNKKMKLHKFVKTLMHKQEVVVVDYYSGETYAKGIARGVSYFLEHNEGRLRNSKIHLIETDTFNPTAICVHVLKNC